MGSSMQHAGWDTASAWKIWVSTVSWVKHHKFTALSGLQSKLCEGTTKDFPVGPQFFHLALEHYIRPQLKLAKRNEPPPTKEKHAVILPSSSLLRKIFIPFLLPQNSSLDGQDNESQVSQGT